MSFEIVDGINNFPCPDKNTVATIGTFDGLHRGHLTLLNRLRKTAEQKDLYPIVMTFNPHPRELITPHAPPPLLTTNAEKQKLFSELIDGTLLFVEFNRKLMNTNARDFVKDVILGQLRTTNLIVGYDHAFGKDRSGTIEELKQMSEEFSFELEVVPPVLVDDMPISSTRIRRLFENGDYEKARKLLGHPYAVSGKVARGIGLGHKLGYPTANLEISPRKLLPHDGVYSCSVLIEEKLYKGMMFIGKNHFNPTVPKSVEVNIFDFDDDIYDKDIVVYPESFIRENRKYENTDRLVEQIALDKQEVIKIINKGV